MRLESLLIFYETIKEGSFSAAARKLFLTQPTISVAVRQLENTFGQPLVIRKPKAGLQLTPLGQRVYELVAQIDSQIEQLKTLRQEYLTQNSEIVIECDTVAGTYLISLFLAKFQENHPGVQFTVKQAESSSIESVLNGNCDLALVLDVNNNADSCYMPEVESIPLWEDEYEIIVSPGHSLAGRHFSGNQLLELSYITAPKHTQLRRILDKTLKMQIGGAISSVIELNYPEAVKQNVLLLNKPGIVLRSTTQCALREHRLFKVYTDLDLRCQHVLAFHKNSKQVELIQLFIKFLKSQSLSKILTQLSQSD